MADIRRKTENIFDVNGDMSYINPKVSIIDDYINISFIDSSNTSYIYYSKEYPAGTYSISLIWDGGINPLRLLSHTSFDGSTYNSYYNGYYKDLVNNSQNIVTFSGDFDIGFVFAGTGGSSGTVRNIMFYSGSIATPYKPYWPHSLRKLTTATDTLTTLPADIYADGNNATVGLKGNMSQTGTPTPSNPIQPQETGERTGNLFDFEQLKNAPSGTIGSITFPHVLALQLKANTYYTMASNGTGSTSSTPADLYRSIYFNSTTGESSVNRNDPVTVLTDSTGVVRIGFFSERTNAQQYLSGEAQLWINEGTTALPYEPYGYKIPISSANTTTPVYLGEVETTRKIKKLVLTGSEDLAFSLSDDNRTVCYLTNLGCANALCLCTHIEGKRSYSSNEYNRILTYGDLNGALYISIEKELVGSTLETFKAYLSAQYTADTPVTVYYVLFTPETGIVNEPIRKIGNYADTVSGITIPTIAGADSFDVLTTLKPSEVSLAYTGWHDASVKEWDGSQWQ